MSWPNVRTGFETFFEPTRIWLFGKPFPSLIYNPDSMAGLNDNGDPIGSATAFGSHVTGSNIVPQNPPSSSADAQKSAKQNLNAAKSAANKAVKEAEQTLHNRQI